MAQKMLPHQTEAFDFLRTRKRALLLDEPGAGKTLPTVNAARFHDPQRTNTIVVCPAVAVGMWKRAFGDMTMGPLVMSYDYVTLHSTYAGVTEAFAKAKVVILDEVHYLNNPAAKRTMVLLGPSGLCRPVEYLWGLSGTVMPRHAGQLYPLLRGFWPDKFKITYNKWLDATCVQQTKYFRGKTVNSIVGLKPGVGDKIKATLFNPDRQLALRRTLEEVGIHLPEILWQRYFHDAGEYRKFIPTEDKYDMDEGQVRVEDATYQNIGLAKVDAAAMLIREDIKGGRERILVFAKHLAVIDTLVHRLGTREEDYPEPIIYVIRGDTPQANREHYISTFQIPKELRPANAAPIVLIAQIDTMATAVTLTEAEQVDIVESSWTAATDDQAVARVHRIGRTTPVPVRVHVVKNSVDDAITRAHFIQNKARLEVGV